MKRRTMEPSDLRTPVECFGIHWSRQIGIPFLHEEEGARPISVHQGLADYASPFEVIKMPRGIKCPHRYGDPLHEDASEHPLVVAMGAQQQAGCFFIREHHAHWIRPLASMTPIAHGGIIEPFWFYTDAQLGRELGGKLRVTNAAPLIVIYERPVDFREVELLTHFRRTRNLIVSGPIKPPLAVELSPDGLNLTDDWPLEGRRQFAAATTRI